MDTDNDLFSAALESIQSSKRVEKFQRFHSEFRRECGVTLNNAQEWIKAELPITDNDIDLAALKKELKSKKISERRKHLLSALIFERTTRDATHQHQAATAALMAMHMLSHIWQAKLEPHESQAAEAQAIEAVSSEVNQPPAKVKPAVRPKAKAEQEIDARREQILTSLIQKGATPKGDSQAQEQNTSNESIKKTTSKNAAPVKQKTKDVWNDTKIEDSRIQQKLSATAENKNKSIFAKVRDKIPMKLGAKTKPKKSPVRTKPQPSKAKNNADDSLLDDPNRSAITVRSGFSKDFEDLMAQAEARSSDTQTKSRPSEAKTKSHAPDDPNASGITVRKTLKKRDHAAHDAGSRTVVMKLASNTGISENANLSIP